MNIIKRSGEEKTFDRGKIASAIRKANDTVEAADKLTEARIEKIAEQIEAFAAAHDRALAVEEVQDIVETKTIETWRCSQSISGYTMMGRKLRNWYPSRGPHLE